MIKKIDEKINPKTAQQAALIALYEKVNVLVDEVNYLAQQNHELRRAVLALGANHEEIPHDDRRDYAYGVSGPGTAS